MRQVPHDAGSPAHHLLIGNGRLSRHMSRYFTLLGLSFESWTKPREVGPSFLDFLQLSEKAPTHVWILVSDSAIAAVAESVRKYLPSEEVHLLHASGAKVVEGVRGAHPLMTFAGELYDLPTYQRIPFIVEDLLDGAPVESLLGDIPNLAIYLAAAKRPLYHALVSVSGNFPSMLWSEVFRKFEEELSLPRALLAPFLFQSLTNVVRSGADAVTGPLVRGDSATVRAHQQALQGSSLGEVYPAFIEFYKQSFSGATVPSEGVSHDHENSH
jgi:predicted short-subunit dehydrogenase-like oxidoreductase (DUF2520 family)